MRKKVNEASNASYWQLIARINDLKQQLLEAETALVMFQSPSERAKRSSAHSDDSWVFYWDE